MLLTFSVENFRSIRDLQTLKTPYGQDYMAIAGDYGPTVWDCS